MSSPVNDYQTHNITYAPLTAKPSALPDEPYQYDFYFYGTGTEYFKIWIVNLVLTILTLGIYSPWAKVRRLRYFYGNTELNDEPFDFTANPKRILLGRLIALGVYVAISVLGQFSPIIATIGGFLILALFPWLMRSTLRFRARNSQYKNVRFAFMGSLLAAYILFVFVAVANMALVGAVYLSSNSDASGAVTGVSVSMIVIALLMPFAWKLFKTYQFNNTQFGEMQFEWHASLFDVYKAVAVPIVIAIAVLIGGAVVMELGVIAGSDFGVGLVAIAMIGVYIMMLLIWPLTQACLHKVVWDNLTVGDSALVLNDFSIFRFAFIQFTNLLMIILTLGLFSPWAAVRLHRYKVETLSLLSYENFDELVTPTMAETSALGEEIADVFDIDVSW